MKWHDDFFFLLFLRRLSKKLAGLDKMTPGYLKKASLSQAAIAKQNIWWWCCRCSLRRSIACELRRAVRFALLASEHLL